MCDEILVEHSEIGEEVMIYGGNKNCGELCATENERYGVLKPTMCTVWWW